MLAAFAALFALMVAAAAIGVVRRRHPLFLRRRVPEPASTRFVPHWQLMLMLGAFFLFLAGSLVWAVVKALR